MSPQPFIFWGFKVKADFFKLATSIYTKGCHITDYAIFLLLLSLALLWMIVCSGIEGIEQVKIHLRHLSLVTWEVTKHPWFHTLKAQTLYFSTSAAKKLLCHWVCSGPYFHLNNCFSTFCGLDFEYIGEDYLFDNFVHTHISTDLQENFLQNFINTCISNTCQKTLLKKKACKREVIKCHTWCTYSLWAQRFWKPKQ